MPPTEDLVIGDRKIRNLALRDHRKYIDVLMGNKQSASKEDDGTKTMPICFTIDAAENVKITNTMNQAIIAENSEIINITKATKDVAALSKHIKGMYYLSPTRILIVFECMDEVVNAVSKESALWSIFDDIRPRSEGEQFDDRLVWLECYGLHPKCWSKENVKRIGQKWGSVLCIDNDIDSICSLTTARMLVRTKAQNKVEARVRLIFEHGSCDVWLKECHVSCVEHDKTMGRPDTLNRTQN